MVSPYSIIKWLKHVRPEWFDEKTYKKSGKPGHHAPIYPIGCVVSGYIMKRVLGNWRRAVAVGIKYNKSWMSQKRGFHKVPNCMSSYIMRLQRHFGKDYAEKLEPLVMEFMRTSRIDWDRLDAALTSVSRWINYNKL